MRENSFPKLATSFGTSFKYAGLVGLCCLLPIQAMAQQAKDYPNAGALLTDERFLGAPRTADGSDPVRAIVNGTPIRESEVRDAAKNLPRQYQNLPLEMVTGLILNRLIDRKLMAAEGRRQKLHKTEEVQRLFFDKAEEALQEVYLTRFTEGLITDDKIKARYDQLVDSMPKLEELHVHHIWVATEGRAQELLDRLNDGAAFDSLAREFSIGPEASKGGDIGYITRNDMGKDFFEAAADLTVNNYSKSPVKSSIGWHIIQLKDRRSLPVPSLSEQRQSIVGMLSQEAITQHLKDLRKKASVQLIRNKEGEASNKARKPAKKQIPEIIVNERKEEPAEIIEPAPEPVIKPVVEPAEEAISGPAESGDKKAGGTRVKIK